MKEEAKDNYRSRYILGSVLGIIGIIGFYSMVGGAMRFYRRTSPDGSGCRFGRGEGNERSGS